MTTAQLRKNQEEDVDIGPLLKWKEDGIELLKRHLCVVLRVLARDGTAAYNTSLPAAIFQ